MFDFHRFIYVSFVFYSFLPHDAMLSPVYAAVVSVTRRYCIKTAKRRITQIMPHDSPSTSFLTPKFTAKFEWDHPLRGRQMQVGGLEFVTFDAKTCYNSKTVQDRRIVSIKVE